MKKMQEKEIFVFNIFSIRNSLFVETPVIRYGKILSNVAQSIQ